MSIRAPRSVADDIRSRSVEQLQVLIMNRPDLVNPMPEDLTELAARVTNPTSVRVALDNLNLQQLQLLQQLGGCAPGSLRQFAQANSIEFENLQDLWDRALLWGQSPNEGEAALFVAGPVRTILGEAFGSALNAGDDGGSDAAGGEAITRAGMNPAELSGPLSAHLAPDGGPDTSHSNSSQVAMQAVIVVDDVARWIQSTRPRLRKAGGIGIRDLTAMAGAIGLDSEQAGFWLELTAQAGFLGLAAVDTWGSDYEVVLTESFDAWCTLNFANQWLELVRVWATTDSAPHLINTETQYGERINALSGKATQSESPSVRMAALRALGEIKPGYGLSQEQLQQIVEHRFPRLDFGIRQEALGYALDEGSWLGVVARVREAHLSDKWFLSELGRDWSKSTDQVAEGDAASNAVPEHGVATYFPQEVDQVIAQADMTLVVPGPPSAELRKLLGQIAHRESTGGATVYRLTPDTLRSAMTLGADPEQILAELELKSLTPVPQPMQYLIADSAKSIEKDSESDPGNQSKPGQSTPIRAERSLDGYMAAVGNSKAGFGVPLSADEAESIAATLWRKHD